MKKSVTIIILNYNGWGDTIECLKSLKATIVSEQYDVSLIVVDNNSQNESVEKLTEFMSASYGANFCCSTSYREAVNHKILLFCSAENLGFSAGNNIGIRIALMRNSDYVMLLNNDTVVDNVFLPPLVEMLESDNSLGMVGPKIVDYYHRDEYTLGGYFSKYKCSGYSYYNTNKADRKYLNYLSGCCWLIPTFALKKCGLMDEAYFLYVEDVDYSCTFLKNNYNLSCTKDSVIYHKEGRSTIVKPTLYYYNTRNRLYLCNKLCYGGLSKFIFYSFLLVTRINYYLKRPELRHYICRAIIDFKKAKFGKFD